LKPDYCELRWWRGLSYYESQNKIFLSTCIKELERVSPTIPFHEETAPAHFPVFTNCVSTRDFDLVLNSLKPVVVGKEVKCFDFPLTCDIKHKPMDARLLTNVDEEGGQEKTTSVYSENLDVFKDTCNIAEINNKYAKFFAEKIKNMIQEMYNIHLADKPDKRLKGSVVSYCLATYISRVSKLKKSY
jgi:hypothetical protein